MEALVVELRVQYEMENLRECVLGGKVETLRSRLNDPSLDQDQLYNEVCRLYDELKVKGVVLLEEVHNLLVQHVVKFELNYNQSHHTSRRINNSLDTQKRIKIMLKVIEEYSGADFQFVSNDEMVHFLKFTARNMNCLMYNHKECKIEWEKLQFLVCMLIGSKLDDPQNINPYVDNHFQLIFPESFIWRQLNQILVCKGNLNQLSSKDGDWTELDRIYQMSRYYYLLNKTYFNLGLLLEINYDQFLTIPKVFLILSNVKI